MERFIIADVDIYRAAGLARMTNKPSRVRKAAALPLYVLGEENASRVLAGSDIIFNGVQCDLSEGSLQSC